MQKSNNKETFKVSICPVCGKRYIRPTDSVYRAYIDKKYVGVCSWGCVRKNEKELEKNERNSF